MGGSLRHCMHLFCLFLKIKEKKNFFLIYICATSEALCIKLISIFLLNHIAEGDHIAVEVVIFLIIFKMFHKFKNYYLIEKFPTHKKN